MSNFTKGHTSFSNADIVHYSTNNEQLSVNQCTKELRADRGQHHRIQVSELWNFPASVDLFILDVCYLFN